MDELLFEHRIAKGPKPDDLVFPNGIGGVQGHFLRMLPPVAGREKISIAVLPFRSLSVDQEDSYTAMGIGSEINSALSRVPGVRVASHLATYRYRNNEIPDLSRIAAELNIRYVFTGSLRRGDRWRLARIGFCDAQNRT